MAKKKAKKKYKTSGNIRACAIKLGKRGGNATARKKGKKKSAKKSSKRKQTFRFRLPIT